MTEFIIRIERDGASATILSQSLLETAIVSLRYENATIERVASMGGDGAILRFIATAPLDEREQTELSFLKGALRDVTKNDIGGLIYAINCADKDIERVEEFEEVRSRPHLPSKEMELQKQWNDLLEDKRREIQSHKKRCVQ